MSDGGGAAAGAGLRRSRLPGIVAAAALAAVAVVLAVAGGDDESPATERPPRIVGPAALIELADDLGHPVYWAGPRPPRRLELSERSGDTYVRYLPPRASAGAEGALLTVGTYAVADAAAAVRRAAAEAGVAVESGPRGSVVLAESAPTSAYMVRPGSDLQVEVFDPRPGRAAELVRSGAIVSVGGGG